MTGLVFRTEVRIAVHDLHLTIRLMVNFSLTMAKIETEDSDDLIRWAVR